MKTAFWTALCITILFLLAIFADPLVGLLYVVCFGVVTWGIRRRQRWAAIAGAICILLPLSTVIAEGDRTTMYITIPSHLVITALLVRGAFDKTASTSPVLPWLALILLAASLRFTTRIFIVPTGAMENTILVGDHILARTVGFSPARGDLVVFHYPVDRRQVFIKRVVGVPGDRIRIQHKQLFRNGAPFQEPYAIHSMSYEDSYRDNFPAPPDSPVYPQAVAMLKDNVQGGEVVVPSGAFFVMGDNRDVSLDSRYWGFIRPSDIIGKPLLIYSSNDVTTDNMKNASILNMRWNRILKLL